MEIINNRKYSDRNIYRLKISPQRDVNQINLISNTKINLLKLAINNEILYEGKEKTIRARAQMARIYSSNELIFIVDIEIAAQHSLDLSLIEISPNLLESHQFTIPKRPKEYIPKPFVATDSIITKQTIINSER